MDIRPLVHLVELEVLVLAINAIKFIPPAFTVLVNLRSLLICCQHEAMEDIHSLPPGLRKLDLS